MRRKLIKQDAFEKITNESVSAAERELIEAQSVLGKALGKDHLALHCFNESTVVFETKDNTFVHASYEIKNDKITFNNIEELVIDESSRNEKRRSILSEMIDSVLVDDAVKAESLFSSYLGMVRWNEAKNFGKDDDEKGGKKGKNPFAKKEKGDKKGFGKKHDDAKKADLFKKAKGAGKELAEAYAVSQNVLDYVDFVKVGPVLAESVTKTDERGNVTDLRIPTLRQRNESRLQKADWKTLNHKFADSRKTIPYLSESQEFVRAMSDLYRQNRFSDAAALEEVLENVVRAFPNVLFATQAELSDVIGEALGTAGVKSFDDTTTAFMAEGVLRKAHGAYTERVTQILHLANATKCEANADAYAHFQSVVEGFYPSLDEKFGLERQVFADLYDGLGAVYKKADRQGDKAVKTEAASLANELAAVLNGDIRPDIDLAEEAATWLATIVETNLESGKWNVTSKAHLTVNGDHPDMAKKASTGYSPSKDFSGDWGDEAPAIGQDNHNYKSGKNAKEMRNNSWGQEGAKGDIFPGLKNPYVPKPFGDYTMKPEKGVDKDNKDHSLWSSGDTWPNLKNPYVPKEAGGTGGKGYKMKNGKETDLVVDK